MDIKILGTGCPKCNKLENMVKEVLKEMDADATVTKVTDIKEIAKTGVMLTPGLMINSDIKLSGKLPSKQELTKIISKSMET